MSGASSTHPVQESTAVPDPSLTELFARRVAHSPDAPAVSSGDVEWTYRQLDGLTNSLAERLRDLGAGPGRLVALYADRSPSVVLGMLATVKTGAAYLCVDPSLPLARLRTMIAEADPVVILTETAGADPSGLDTPVVTTAAFMANGDPGTAPDHSGDLTDRSDAPSDAQNAVAYVVYTSGSTGSPKGIRVSHRNVVRRTVDTDFLTFAPGDRVAQLSNAAFDAVTIEVWGALLNGAELIVLVKDDILTPGRLKTVLRERHVDTAVVPTPLFNQLAGDDPATFATVSQILVGGDVMGVSQANAVAALPGCVLLNGYGPAECTTLATAHRVHQMPPEQLRVPIGHPVSATSCYVLDETLQPVAPGTPGQLFIGGDGVAIGYVARPELTAEKFLDDPFVPAPGSRMYATGDLVRELPDGSLDFLGRSDLQVKVRGYRVEMGEVDATLAAHPAISEAVTIAEGDPGEKRLVTYFTAASGHEPVTDEIGTFLREQLPEYMVPSRLIPLAELPKNTNMKIDRSRLPAAPVSVPVPVPDNPPTLAAETLVDEVGSLVAHLLGVPSIGPTENFFAAGGQSILAIRLLTQLGRRFKVQITLRQFFDEPTVRGIVAHIRQNAEAFPLPDEQQEATG